MHTNWNNVVGIVAVAVLCLVLGAAAGSMLASASIRNAEIIYNYQGLIGGAVGGLLTVTAAAVAWVAVHRQTAEGRNQFRHQMAILTARERVAVRRAVRTPLEHIENIRRVANDLAGVLGRRDYNIAARYMANFTSAHQAIDQWFESEGAAVARNLLEPEEQDAVRLLIDSLRVFPRLHHEPGPGTGAALVALQNSMDRAEQALVALRTRVDRWVPG